MLLGIVNLELLPHSAMGHVESKMKKYKCGYMCGHIGCFKNWYKNSFFITLVVVRPTNILQEGAISPQTSSKKATIQFIWRRKNNQMTNNDSISARSMTGNRICNVLYCTVLYLRVQYSTVLNIKIVQYSTVLNIKIVQCDSTVLYCTLKYSIVQYSYVYGLRNLYSVHELVLQVTILFCMAQISKPIYCLYGELASWNIFQYLTRGCTPL